MVKRLAGFREVTPAEAGLPSAPFEVLREATRKDRRLQSLPGVAHVVLYRGQCVFSQAEGWADRGRRARFGFDTLCKLHGCTKPLVSAAFLTLVDAGKVRLSDPVAKHVRFADRVAVGSGGRARPVKTRARLRDLLTMTAGLGYEDTEAYAAIMQKIRSGDIADLAGLCDALADLPLVSEPGGRYHYSFATDVLGRVCEEVSGMRLDKFLEHSLLRPLGMKDTHFVVPPRKRQRAAVLYRASPADAAAAAGRAPFVLRRWSHADRAPGIMSGGGGILSYEDPGLWSTVQDYARFCQLLLDDGLAPGGRRVLRPATARALWRDGLAPCARRGGRVPGWNDSDGPGTRGGFWDYTGCSLLHSHLEFREPPSSAKRARTARSMWMAGGGGCSWAVDRGREMAALTFYQCFDGRASEEDGLGALGNDAAPYAREAVDGRGRARGGRAAQRGA